MMSYVRSRMMIRCALILACLCASIKLPAQVYSPTLLRKGQPDTTDMKSFADSICLQANAHTPRERAEAIWRFFLTDGRFVEPGFWYHIAGWTYEEPSGEVLDPIKMLNSYGFGLCYHIAPLLEAVYQAAGFKDARCWFLTGHTVTEVFYEGRYHYFDSDMMGYNVANNGSFHNKPVASVRDLEQDPAIMLGKLDSPRKVKAGEVDSPWYPADVNAGAIGNLADVFTTTKDNYLYPYTRHSDGHQMDFELRPGETLTRFFKPEEPELYYLPYRFDGKTWKEFPQEIAEYKIKTLDGPKSQKDERLWATGRFDYKPGRISQAVTIIPMASPYVIIDARFKMDAKVPSAGHLRIETSVDNGSQWTVAGELTSAHDGEWSVEPHVILKSEHGRLTAVSGSYGYLVRISKSEGVTIADVQLTSRVQLNPRSLPFLTSGKNNFVYKSKEAAVRTEISGALSKAKLRNMECIDEDGQQMLRPKSNSGEALYELTSENGPLTGFDAGARFLDLRDGLAPDKLTAETRHTAVVTKPGDASISWALSPTGPFHKIWGYNDKLNWQDGDPVQRLLRWPQVFKQVRDLPAGTTRVFLKLSSSGPAIDDIRLAEYAKGAGASPMKITHIWTEGGQRHQHEVQISSEDTKREYTISAGDRLDNAAVVFAVAK